MPHKHLIAFAAALVCTAAGDTVAWANLPDSPDYTLSLLSDARVLKTYRVCAAPTGTPTDIRPQGVRECGEG